MQLLHYAWVADNGLRMSEDCACTTSLPLQLERMDGARSLEDLVLEMVRLVCNGRLQLED